MAFNRLTLRILAALIASLLLLPAGVVIAEGADDRLALTAKLAPYYQPPPEFADDFGGYKSPLEFADGTRVKSAEDWQRRRAEILKLWHERLGTWPPLLEKPAV